MICQRDCCNSGKSNLSFLNRNRIVWCASFRPGMWLGRAKLDRTGRAMRNWVAVSRGRTGACWAVCLSRCRSRASSRYFQPRSNFELKIFILEESNKIKIISNSFHKFLYNPQRTERFSEGPGRWRQAEPAVLVPCAATGHQRLLSAQKSQCRQWRGRHRGQSAWHLHRLCKFCWKFEFTLEPLSQDLGWNYSYSLTFLASIF